MIIPSKSCLGPLSPLKDSMINVRTKQISSRFMKKTFFSFLPRRPSTLSRTLIFAHLVSLFFVQPSATIRGRINSAFHELCISIFTSVSERQRTSRRSMKCQKRQRESGEEEKDLISSISLPLHASLALQQRRESFCAFSLPFLVVLLF